MIRLQASSARSFSSHEETHAATRRARKKSALDQETDMSTANSFSTSALHTHGAQQPELSLKKTRNASARGRRAWNHSGSFDVNRFYPKTQLSVGYFRVAATARGAASHAPPDEISDCTAAAAAAHVSCRESGVDGEGGVDSYFEPQILMGDPLRGKTRVAQFWFLKDWGRGRA